MESFILSRKTNHRESPVEDIDSRQTNQSEVTTGGKKLYRLNILLIIRYLIDIYGVEKSILAYSCMLARLSEFIEGGESTVDPFIYKFSSAEDTLDACIIGANRILEENSNRSIPFPVSGFLCQKEDEEIVDIKLVTDSIKRTYELIPIFVTEKLYDSLGSDILSSLDYNFRPSHLEHGADRIKGYFMENKNFVRKEIKKLSTTFHSGRHCVCIAEPPDPEKYRKSIISEVIKFVIRGNKCIGIWDNARIAFEYNIEIKGVRFAIFTGYDIISNDKSSLIEGSTFDRANKAFGIFIKHKSTILCDESLKDIEQSPSFKEQLDSGYSIEHTEQYDLSFFSLVDPVRHEICHEMGALDELFPVPDPNLVLNSNPNSKEQSIPNVVCEGEICSIR